MTPHRMSLPGIVHALHESYGCTKSYPRMLLDVIAGDVPCIAQSSSGRWTADAADLPKIAAALGLTKKSA